MFVVPYELPSVHILDILSFRMWLDDLSVSEFKFGLANPLHQGHPHHHIKWVGLFAPPSPLNHHHHFSPLVILQR